MGGHGGGTGVGDKERVTFMVHIVGLFFINIFDDLTNVELLIIDG